VYCHAVLEVQDMIDISMIPWLKDSPDTTLTRREIIDVPTLTWLKDPPEATATREEIKWRMKVTIANEVPMHKEKLVLNEDTIAENSLWFAP
jgi:hypothetical protein